MCNVRQLKRSSWRSSWVAPFWCAVRGAAAILLSRRLWKRCLLLSSIASSFASFCRELSSVFFNQLVQSLGSFSLFLEGCLPNTLQRRAPSTTVWWNTVIISTRAEERLALPIFVFRDQFNPCTVTAGAGVKLDLTFCNALFYIFMHVTPTLVCNRLYTV